MKFPRLIRVVYIANYLTQLRKWYVMKTWKKLLKESPEDAKVVDFGAGEAQYLVPFCRKYPYKTFYSTDNRQSNSDFANAFQIRNLKGHLLDIEQNSFFIKSDVAICVGVMQYLEKDENALLNMNHSLKPDGKLLLYVPINGEILTGFYKLVFNKYEHYESINARKRVYGEEEICSKLENAGFKIIQKTYTYGFFGKLSHELLNTCSTLLFSGAILLRILVLPVLVLLYPLVIIFMLIDFKQEKKSGNGILLYLGK